MRRGLRQRMAADGPGQFEAQQRQPYCYVRSSGKDVQFALAVLEDREAVVLEVKFNPDAAARFLENPKIMGISLGKSIRGNNAAVASNARPRPAAQSFER